MTVDKNKTKTRVTLKKQSITIVHIVSIVQIAVA